MPCNSEYAHSNANGRVDESMRVARLIVFMNRLGIGDAKVLSRDDKTQFGGNEFKYLDEDTKRLCGYIRNITNGETRRFNDEEFESLLSIALSHKRGPEEEMRDYRSRREVVLELDLWWSSHVLWDKRREGEV